MVMDSVTSLANCRRNCDVFLILTDRCFKMGASTSPIHANFLFGVFLDGGFPINVIMRL